MPVDRRWCKHCVKVTWHLREWSFPRSPALGLIALLALPIVWWYDPWDWTVCDRRAKREPVSQTRFR